MLQLQDITIAGMHCDGDILWLAAPYERLVATYHPSTGKTEKKITYTHEIWDVCPHGDDLWLVTGGGSLGRQIVFWSLGEGREIRKFNCPDGAGAGMTLLDGKIWLTHRHNRKLFCLDPGSGKVNWIIRTEHETFSPAAYKNKLWLIESDPGPLGHWSESRQGKYFFSHYDPVRERIVERLPVSFVPRCMAFDGERFWYAEQGKKGIATMKRAVANNG
ncbi:hypothetical protein EPO44_19575 [bacterium]|nr:MAG: hypothetical protein EPO44_19575 [bacterium]